ncbi:MAG TPA: Gfo/Idh/MocA family oxidoreductase [Candidatus Limnocylindria bacterium]
MTLAIIGAGNRGRVYAGFAERHPEIARVVAIAEPRPFQRERLRALHGVPAERSFSSWEEPAALPRMADAVVIATADALHADVAAAFAARGYDLLLEKPMATTEDDCVRIVEAVERAGVILAVCHVMRYTPYTRALKALLAAGRIGELVSVQHLEPVGWWHQAHSYVRGNWRREDESTFMLMAKSCHDLDWLRYIVGRPWGRVSSFGGLTHFRPEARPDGAADRCLDCAVEADCAYSAKRFYLECLETPERRRWPLSVITDDLTVGGVQAALRDGPYGRCVYGCDNDVVDHQVVSIEFAGGVTAAFTMTAFAEPAPRKTQLFGTRGSIDGDGRTIKVFDFLTRRTESIEVPAPETGHSGGDDGVIAAFCHAVATRDGGTILSGPRESLETHRMVFAAERARRDGTVVSLDS